MASSYSRGSKGPESCARPVGTGKKTWYRTGQNFHLYYSIGYQLTGKLQVAFNGYYWKDITDDEINGDKIDDSRGQVFAIGPAFQFNCGKLSLTLKSQFETNVKNRPRGIMNWVKVVCPF